MGRLAVDSVLVALESESVSECSRVVSLGHWEVASERKGAEMELAFLSRMEWRSGIVYVDLGIRKCPLDCSPLARCSLPI